MESIVIKKKKFWPTIWLFISGLPLLMFFSASIAGFTQIRPWFEYIFLLIFLVLSVFGLLAVIKGFKKVFSISPEFELNKKEIIIYDHPKYSGIEFSEMIEANVYRGRYSTMIGISFIPGSKYGKYLSDLRRIAQGVSKEKSKKIFISLEFADIEAEDLRDIINKRIEMSREENRSKPTS